MSKLYTDCDVPATIFFKVMSKGDYTLLGEGTPEEQESAFYSIFDEFYTLRESNKLKKAYTKSNRVSILKLQIQLITTILHQIVFVPMTTSERIQCIDILNDIDGLKIKFNTDKPIVDEVSRVQTKILGHLKNELNREMSTEKKQNEGLGITFERELASICISLGIYLNSNISLREYIEYEKIAVERNNANKKVSKNG